jgi:hypothetical protein
MKENDRDSRLSWLDRWFAIKSIFVLQSMALGLRIFGFNRLYRRIIQWSLPAESNSTTTAPFSMNEAIYVGRLVAIANRRIRPLMVPCLPESLTVLWLLRKRSIPAVMRLGVRKRDDSLDAHAWVEYAGEVVSGDPNMPSAYAPVDLHPAM